MYCRQTVLEEADLTNANLTNADLTNANLTNANLTNATLTGAIFKEKGEEEKQKGKRKANPEAAKTLEGARFYDVEGLTKEQITRCEEKGAVFREPRSTTKHSD